MHFSTTMHAICSTHLILLDLFNATVFCEVLKLEPPHYVVFSSLPSFLGPNILLSTLTEEQGICLNM
jgi:hypothetical protein